MGSVENGVFCLGMHRSGTSAATRLIALLGVRTPPAEDLVQPTVKNPKGYWESELLVWFNERILAAVGSDMRCPAVLAPGWEHDPRLARLREDAPAAVSRVFPTSPWVWKDPRHCLTLGFWRGVLDVAPAAVVVNRNPLEIAASAQRVRTDQGKLYSLAMWERYLRQALDQVAGLPVLITTYDELISDPLAWSDSAQAFLDANNVPAHGTDRDEVMSFVERDLRHVSATRVEFLSDPDVSEPQRALFLALEELEGAHDRFVAPVIPDETPATERLIAERRRALAESARQMDGARSPGWRLRVRSSRYAGPARPIYAFGRRVVEALSAAVGSYARRSQDR
jgi:hypothetical protein